jgi:catechol 2,3-dioxygenase-like lactoylglutathione lyase family enzyme
MASATQGPRHEIDRDIYGMPAYTSLQTSDLAASRRWWTEGLGFVELAVMPGPDGPESLIHLRRYRYQDVLLVGGRPAEAPTPVGISVSFAHAGPLDELATVADRLRQLAAGGVTGPERCRGSRSS